MRFQTLIALALPLVSAAPLEDRAAAAPAVTELSIRTSQRHQQIDGFGFSGAFQRAKLLQNLTAETQKELLDMLYSRETGIGFSILRNGIGSSNSSDKDFMDSILPQSPGSPDGHFNYTWDGKDSGQFFLAQQAVKYGVQRIYADAWSAPGFMKTNGDDANGGLLCGVPGSEGMCKYDWRRAYADYLAKYIQIYKSEGIEITDVTWVNEPDLTTSYASMRFDAAQVANFLPFLRQALRDAGLDTKIGCCEETGWQKTRDMVKQLQALGADKLLDTWTSHEYSSPIDGPLPDSSGKRVWQTEYSDLSGNWNTAWDSGAASGFTWAGILHRALTLGNVSAYLWWEAVQAQATNNNNNEKLIMVQDGKFYVSKRAWAFAQYSRLVRPGAWRVDVQSAAGQAAALNATAYENADKSVVAVVLNTATSATTVKLGLGAAGGGRVLSTAEAWLTDEQHDMVKVAATLNADGTASADLTARGLITIKLS